jgi:dynamin 1-like protein
MLNEFCDIYRNVLSGCNDEKKYSFLADEGGHKVKDHFRELLETYIDDYDCTEYIDDSQINQALVIHEGDSIPGFPSVDAFYYILRPYLEELKGPVQECFDKVYEYLEYLAQTLSEGKDLPKNIIEEYKPYYKGTAKLWKEGFSAFINEFKRFINI